jgi:hypothetical protein
MKPSRSQIVVAVLVGSGFAGGYVLAEWWWGATDRAALAQICAQVDYMNGLQQELPEQRAPADEMRHEFATLVEQCRQAIGSRLLSR